MSQKKRSWFILTLAGFACLANISFAQVSQAANSHSSSTPITIGIPGSLTGPLLPYRSPSATWHGIIHQQFAPLLHLGANFQVEPEIVSRWWYSSDGKKLYMDIAKNAVWSDGQPVTPADVQLSINYLASPYYNNVVLGNEGFRVLPIVGSLAVMHGATQTVSGFHIVNDHEFYLSLKNTNPSILTQDIQGIVPLPAHLLNGIKMTDWGSSAFFKNPTVGDGPYLLQRRVAGALVFHANPRFVLGAPHIPLMQYTSVSTQALTGLFRAGAIDVFSGLNTAQANTLASFAQIAATPKDEFVFLGWNDQQPGASNSAFRQAVLYSIDRDKLIKDMLSGYAVVQNGPLPVTSVYYDPKLTNQYPYNPQTARNILQKAGFYIGGHSWLVTPDGGSLHVVINYAAGDASLQAVAAQIVQDLQNIGVDAVLHGPLSVAQMVQAMQANQAGTLQGYLMGWQLGADPLPSELWLPSSELNRATINWTDTNLPGVQSNEMLIQEQQTVAAQNTAYRTTVLRQWQELVSQEAPAEFLYDPDLLGAVSHRLQGVVWSGLYGPIETWKWSLNIAVGTENATGS